MVKPEHAKCYEKAHKDYKGFMRFERRPDGLHYYPNYLSTDPTLLVSLTEPSVIKDFDALASPPVMFNVYFELKDLAFLCHYPLREYYHVTVPEGTLVRYTGSIRMYAETVVIGDRVDVHEVYMASISRMSSTFKFVPREAYTPEILLCAVSGCNNENYKHIPSSMKTYEITFAAASRYQDTPKFMPYHHWTHELCEEMSLSFPENVRYFPEKMQTQEHWDRKAKLRYFHPVSIEEIPERFRTDHVRKTIEGLNKIFSADWFPAKKKVLTHRE